MSGYKKKEDKIILKNFYVLLFYIYMVWVEL